jgi:hypothetical protein
MRLRHFSNLTDERSTMIVHQLPEPSITGYPVDNVRYAGCRIMWTWPRRLRLLEKAWRRLRRRWVVIYEFRLVDPTYPTSLLIEED